MAIYKTQWFDRWARKQGVGSLALCAAVREMTDGLYEADLGGGLLKKRIARAGQHPLRMRRVQPRCRPPAGKDMADPLPHPR